MNKIFLYIRRTKNYFLTREIDKVASNVLGGGTTDNVQNSLVLWPQVTGKQYKLIRSQINRLVYAENSTKKFDAIYNYSYDKIQDDVWIMPIDEDDLVSNHCIKIIRESEITANSVIWQTTLVSDTVRVSGLGWTPSNSYAVRSEFVKDDMRLVHKHMYFAEKELSNAQNLGIVSGLKLETPASAGTMWKYKTADELRTGIEIFKSIDSSDIPQNFRTVFRAIQDIFTIV